MPAASPEAICNMALGFAGVRTRILSIDEASPAAQQCKVYYSQVLDEVLTGYRWPYATRRADLAPYAGNAWAAGTAYNQNDMVQYGALVYRSQQGANTSNTPGTSAAWWAQVTRDGWAFACPLPPDFVQVVPGGLYQKPTNGPTATVDPFVGQAPPAPVRAPLSAQKPPYKLEDANDGTGQQVILTDLQSPSMIYLARVTGTSSFSPSFIKALSWSLSVPLCLAMRADPGAAKALAQLSSRMVAEAVATEMRGEREDAEPVSEFEYAREH